MIKLIDTRLVAKLMKETAKECGMTRLYSATDLIWWGKGGKLAEQGAIYPMENYRRIVKAYDCVADNFIELLEAKVKAEGFDLADNGITFSKCPTTRIDYPAAKKKYGKKYFLLPTEDYPRKDHYLKGGTYIRMVCYFKAETYRVVHFNYETNEYKNLCFGFTLKSCVETWIDYYIKSEHYPDITKDSEFGVERIQTGEQFSLLFRKEGHTYDTNYYLEATEWEEKE